MHAQNAWRSCASVVADAEVCHLHGGRIQEVKGGANKQREPKLQFTFGNSGNPLLALSGL